MNFKDVFDKVGEKVALEAMNFISDLIVLGLNNWPEDKELELKGLLGTGYVVFDIFIEQMAAQTETPFDDKLVSEFKEAFEEKAKALGMELPNLDAD